MIIQRIKNKISEALKVPYRYAIGVFPYSWRYGGEVYRETYQFLQKSQWWSEEQHRDYQLMQLRKLLTHAYQNTEYYKKIFNNAGFRPERFNDLEDLHSLPFLTKEDLRENLDEMIATNIAKNEMRYGTTGGSTGYPVGFYERVVERNQVERAFLDIMWSRVGYRPGEHSAVLRGNVITKGKDGNRWVYRPTERELILSSYHLTEDSADLYEYLINKYKIRHLRAYPSAATILSKYLLRRKGKVRFPHLRNVLSASEMLYDWQRKLISEAFGCRLFDFYGLSERTLMGGECEHSSTYHFFPEYGYLELIDDKGCPITVPSQPGEIVGTGFTNYATPFIRYRTGDRGVLSKKKCVCGRNYPLLEKIEGRVQDIVVTKDGRNIPLTALIFAQHFDAFAKLKQMQLEQNKPGEIIVRIVKDFEFSTVDEAEIHEKILAACDGLKCSFQYVDHIPLTERGKNKFLIQNLPIEVWMG